MSRTSARLGTLRVRLVAGAGAALLVSITAFPAASSPSAVPPEARSGPIRVISQTPDGTGGSGRSAAPRLSGTGRFVVFGSVAGDLVDDDSNGAWDVFVRDRSTGTTELVSRHPGGAPGDDHSGTPDISADGRYVVFHSWASGLVPEDTNDYADIFRLDRTTGALTMLSYDADGGSADQSSFWPRISDDGRFVAFQSEARDLTADETWEGMLSYDVFVRDIATGVTTMVSRGLDGAAPDGNSDEPAISGDGRYIVFQSGASNLIDDDTNAHYDVFRYDRGADSLEAISLGPSGGTANAESSSAAVSADGRLIAYQSYATDLEGPAISQRDVTQVDVYLHDARANTTDLISDRRNGSPAEGNSWDPSLSDNGAFISFQSAADLRPRSTDQINAYVHERATGINSFVTRPTSDEDLWNGSDTEVGSRGFVVFLSHQDYLDDGIGSYGDVYGRRAG